MNIRKQNNAVKKYYEQRDLCTGGNCDEEDLSSFSFLLFGDSDESITIASQL